MNYIGKQIVMKSSSLRKKIAQNLFHDCGTPNQSFLIEGFLNTLIIINIALEILFSYLQIDTPKFLQYLVFMSGLIFALELYLRVWSCVELKEFNESTNPRLRYILSPLIILDTIAVIPMLLSLGAINTTFLRIFRVFELGPYFAARDISPLTLIQSAVLKRIPEITIIIFILAALIIFSAFLYNLVESSASLPGPLIYSAFPSIEMIMSMLVGSNSQHMQPTTELGSIILTMTQVFGLFLIGLPTALVTGSFVTEIQAINEVKRLREIERVLLSSFDVINPIPVRKFLKDSNLKANARERTLDELEYRLDLNIEDIKKVASIFKTVKIRSIKDPSSKTKRVSVEQLVLNRSYGVLIDKDVNRLVITTQNAGEPALNHFSLTLAENLDCSLVANQLFSSGEFNRQLRQNFADNIYYKDRTQQASTALSDFVNDIEELIKSENEMTVIYITAMNENNPESYHISHRNFENSELILSASDNNDILVKNWSESDAKVLAMIENNNPCRILKIAVSTKILRTDENMKYFQSIVYLRDLLNKTVVGQSEFIDE